MRRRLLLVVLAIALAPFSPAPAGAADPTRASIHAGADRLVVLQNPDGGWFFTVGDTSCGAGSGVSCPNTIGVTALGLAEAYQVTHDMDHLTAAAKAADALVAKHGAAPACDANPLTNADRPFTVDTDFLADISHLGKIGKIVGSAAKKNYREIAEAWFACVVSDFPSAAARADNRINGRIAQGLTNLGAWDASLDIRAAIELGEKKYAEAEALQVIARENDWDVADPDCTGCNLLAKGLFLEATHELEGKKPIRTARNAWKEDLLSAQLPNGSWFNSTQTTAYIIRGLDKTSKNKATKDAIKAGADFILNQQQPNGGFLADVGFPDEITEVDAEAIGALAVTR